MNMSNLAVSSNERDMYWSTYIPEIQTYGKKIKFSDFTNTTRKEISRKMNAEPLGKSVGF